MGEALSLQRSNGLARVGFARNGNGQTVLESLHQSGAAKVRFPKDYDEGRTQAVLINTAGGVTGGDRFDFVLSAGRGAEATVTSQACERIYRAAHGASARIATKIEVRAGGRFSWLPQETIVFDGGRLDRTLDIDLAGDATFLGVESFLLGRRAMGEKINWMT
jgi:urease accessory protein